jgi:hypothetical protein
MASLGFSALALALAISIYVAIASIIAARKGYPELEASSRNGMLVADKLCSQL